MPGGDPLTSDKELFHDVIVLPEPVRQRRYERLVGLNHIKERLRKEAAVLANPAQLAR